MGSSIKQALTGLAATLALLALVVGFPLALAGLVGWPLPAGIPSWEEMSESARSGIDDMVIVKSLAVLGWIAWSQLALAVAVEAVALARRRAARRIPVIPGFQVTAANLLASAALLGVCSSARGPAEPLGTLLQISQPAAAVEMTASQSAPVQPPPPADQTANTVAAARTYTVQRNDSWWEIAESQLGDGLRWQELRALNVGRPMADGRIIQPDTEIIYEGWILELPDDPTTEGGPKDSSAEAREVVVERGDHLWRIAEAHLEHLHQRPVSDDEIRPYWQEIIAANRDGLVQRSNPDLIFAGQAIRLPGVAPETPAHGALAIETPPGPSGPPADPAEEPAVPESTGRSDMPEVDATTANPSPTTEVAQTDDDNFQVEPDRDEASNAVTAVGMLGTAGAVLAVGISGAVWRRRRRREQRLPRGASAPLPSGDLDELRAEVARSADTDHVEMLRQALADAAGELARRRSAARVRVIQAAKHRIEILLSEPVLPAPSGWRPEASGSAWVCEHFTPAGGSAGHPTHPTFVSLGRRDQEGQLYLDLESEGLLSLMGDEAGTRELARSIMLELATAPTAEGVSILLVGDLDVGENLDRIQRAGTWDHIADDALSWAQQTRALLAANRWPSPQAARAVSDRPDDLSPLVIILTEEPDDERFNALCSTIGETLVPLVVVSVGWKLEGATTIEVDGEELRVPTLGLSCAAQRVSSDTAVLIDRLLASADDMPAQLSLITHPSEDRADEPQPSHDSRYVDPPFDVLVKVLGEIEVVGGRQPLSPKQTAVVTFIALHSPTTAERVEDAVWSAPTASRRKRLANTISDARAALGADHLPAAYDGRYRVGARVKTDLELFERRLAYAKTQDPQGAIETLRGGLELLTGPVFTYRNADRTSYPWVDTQNWICTTELKVTDTAEELAERYHEIDDAEGAIWAAKRGLIASPTHTRLTRLLMRAYFAAGDAKAAERVYESYVSALEQLQLDEIDPELAEAYEQMRRGTAATG